MVSTLRPILQEMDIHTVIDQSGDVSLCESDMAKMKSHLLHGFDNLMSMQNSCEGRKAVVLAHGPSLLSLDKKDYTEHVKITCNDFHKIEFLDDFPPDFWCAANSYEALREPFKVCVDNNIRTIITVPRKFEFLQLIEIAEREDKLNLISPWLWERQMLQAMVASKYGYSQMYSHCNTVTNHMIALALWLGCDSIDVTGFDMSYSRAKEVTGKSHAGVDLPADTSGFESQAQRNQMVADLEYLCKIASENGIVINNLSYKSNELSKILT